ncbi:hypothetical protein [Collimonas humicola]|uniref:hypothetical protein n=1 Tax=Collimonas humicola TaxID=2825886 RepID=UPI001B8BF541|nr:hypothetical protein [Collimonas humicola]
MKFEVLGPYYFPTRTIIKADHIKKLKATALEDPFGASLLSGPGCYVFGVKSSGSARVVPWYVGKAERQSVLKESTNGSHLQLYNEILDEYKRGRPALYFVPAVTLQGRGRSPVQKGGKMPAVDFLEDWLIARALQSNPGLWNARKTKLLRELSVRGIFNPTKGDMTLPSASLKECLDL